MGVAKQAKRCPASVATPVDRLSVGGVVETSYAKRAKRSPASIARSVDRQALVLSLKPKPTCGYRQARRQFARWGS